MPTKIQKTASDLVLFEGGKHKIRMGDGRQVIAWVSDNLWRGFKRMDFTLLQAFLVNGKRRERANKAKRSRR